MSKLVVIDGNCLTYFIQAMQHDPRQPADALASEKIALLRVYLYAPDVNCFHITPTVRSEVERISDAAKRQDHESWLHTIVDCLQLSDTQSVERRAQQLVTRAAASGRHAGRADAVILAECEAYGAGVLLTYDVRFNGFLRTQAIRTQILRPTEFWAALAIPRGSRLARAPHSSNPLAQETWWRW